MRRISSMQLRSLAGLLAAGTSCVTPSALACGGFFCSRTAPVFQAAERIIFAQDGEHVTQILGYYPCLASRSRG